MTTASRAIDDVEKRNIVVNTSSDHVPRVKVKDVPKPLAATEELSATIGTPLEQQLSQEENHNDLVDDLGNRN